MDISGIGVISAFVAGLISFLSPRVPPLVPGYLSFISDQSLDGVERHVFSRERLAIMGLGLCFVLGFSVVFIAFGAGATTLGSLLGHYRYDANIVGAVIVIIFGLFMTGLIRWNWLQRELRFHGEMKGGRAASAGVLGIAFGFGWTPCIGPILGAILAVAATSSSQGASLLAIYSLGFGVPFLLAALFTDWFLHHMHKARRFGPWLHRIAGMRLIVMGTAMITGYLGTFSFWLLDTFPILGSIA
ncbi:MAG: cytochrome c biogenesis protein CcdA [Proteobacteria bacterium]|nr:MAG: cytochrome c biogenesis protein CcdA [Pseudomonadota bacterium]QKK10686.1 MAG: cytochrome c biogenesis protein CcdA [Pseudomonadota bacterium]